MKKIVLIFLSSYLLFSCVGEKKKETSDVSKVNEVEKANFSIIFQGVYEKDDELVVQYKKGGYMQYDNPIKLKITGQPTIQSLIVDIPSGDVLENLQFFISTNKEQKFVKLNNIIITNNGKEVFKKNNLEYLKYFNSNEGVVLDEINQRYNLNFSGQFPPGFTGNDYLESVLVP